MALLQIRFITSTTRVGVSSAKSYTNYKKIQNAYKLFQELIKDESVEGNFPEYIQ